MKISKNPIDYTLLVGLLLLVVSFFSGFSMIISLIALVLFSRNSLDVNIIATFILRYPFLIFFFTISAGIGFLYKKRRPVYFFIAMVPLSLMSLYSDRSLFGVMKVMFYGLLSVFYYPVRHKLEPGI